MNIPWMKKENITTQNRIAGLIHNAASSTFFNVHDFHAVMLMGFLGPDAVLLMQNPNRQGFCDIDKIADMVNFHDIILYQKASAGYRFPEKYSGKNPLFK